MAGSGSVAECSQIYDFLFVGSFVSSSPEKATTHGFTLIIDASNVDLPESRINKFPSNVKFHKVPVEDEDTFDIAQFFDEVSDLIHEQKLMNGHVLVHCAAGVSRAPTLAIAYMIKYEGMTLRAAYLHVKKCRRRVSPNYGFWRQLIAYEEQTTGMAPTVKFVKPVSREMPDVYMDEWKETFDI